MKANKTFSLDMSVILALRDSGINSSELVNRILHEHLQIKKSDSKSIELVKSDILKTEAELETMRQKLKDHKLEQERIEKEKGVIFKIGHQN
jgi:hypothetical protein